MAFSMEVSQWAPTVSVGKISLHLAKCAMGICARYAMVGQECPTRVWQFDDALMIVSCMGINTAARLILQGHQHLMRTSLCHDVAGKK